MKIVLFRSNNIFDSRVNKYHNYYVRSGVNYTIVGWDRKGLGVIEKNYDFFRYRAGEDVGGIKAVINHIRWMWFVFKYLNHHTDITTVHACDLNSAFPAALFKALRKKELVLIFDACDWFSANFAHYKILKILFGCMEFFSCKFADELIICEPERIAQVQFKLNKDPLVMRNIPEVDKSLITGVQEKYVFNNNYPTLAYMGGFANARYLMELLELAETEPFNLLIAGSGDKSIMQKCEELNKRDNVKYFGRVNMIDGLNMENAADIVYAMYCKINPNHIFAAPNKYYEALLLGKPMITTKGTIVGDKVSKYNTGWVIDEEKEELKSLINNLKQSDIDEKGNEALNLWESRYKNEIDFFFDNVYKKILK